MATLKFFITGGTGYIGREVVSELVRRGIVVIALVRRATDLEGCRTVVGDLTCVGQLAEEVAGADGIIHLATPRSYLRDAVMSEVTAVALLIDAWRTGPFVFASSATIEGWGPEPLHENSPAQVRNWYELGKLCNEFQLRVAPRLYQRAPAISLRPAGLVIGSNERRRPDQRFAIFYDQCQLGCRFVFLSEELLETSGSSFIGAADLGRGFAESITIKTPGAYNVAGGFCTWKSLIETVRRVVGTRSNVVIRPDGSVGAGEFMLPQSRRCLDVSSFAQTHFAPKQTLEELIHEFVAAEHTKGAPEAKVAI
ncbi:MAG: NAD(P)-dependent oxidoreductase [Candidatus Sulfotelmatobacter sp.]